MCELIPKCHQTLQISAPNRMVLRIERENLWFVLLYFGFNTKVEDLLAFPLSNGFHQVFISFCVVFTVEEEINVRISR